MESLVTLTINDDPALSYARHLDIAADLPRLAPNLRVFHWHYGKQYNQGGGGRRVVTGQATGHAEFALQMQQVFIAAARDEQNLRCGHWTVDTHPPIHCMHRTSTTASTSPICSRGSRTSAWPAASSGDSTFSMPSSLSRTCSGSICMAPSWRRRTSSGTRRTISSPSSPHQPWEIFSWPRGLALFLSRVGGSDYVLRIPH